jgi:hypothetical protein
MDQAPDTLVTIAISNPASRRYKPPPRRTIKLTPAGIPRSLFTVVIGDIVTVPDVRLDR